MSYRNNRVTRVTEFQNRRQRCVSPFSVGVTNARTVAFLSLRFVSEKLIDSVMKLSVALVAPKCSIPILLKQNIKFKRILSKRIKIPVLESTGNSLGLICIIASFAFVLRPPSFGRPQRRLRARPAPLF